MFTRARYLVAAVLVLLSAVSVDAVVTHVTAAPAVTLAGEKCC